MTPEEVVRELYHLFNARDFERAAALFADPCEYETISRNLVTRSGVE